MVILPFKLVAEALNVWTDETELVHVLNVIDADDEKTAVAILVIALEFTHPLSLVYNILKLPPAIAVTTPLLSTVAMLVSELDQGVVASGVPFPVKVNGLPPT